MLDYLYAAMWAVMALILIFRFGRMNRVFYFAGGLFLLFAGCWLARPVLHIDLFAGGYGWAMRAVIAAALVVLCLAYYREIQKNREKDRVEKEKGDGEKKG